MPPSFTLVVSSLTISVTGSRAESTIIHLFVTPSSPCYVWCAPLPYDAPVPMVPLVKSMTQYQLQTGNNEVVLNNLLADTDYSVYCYAETMGDPGVAMTTKIEDTRTDISTRSRCHSHSSSPVENEFHATISTAVESSATAFPIAFSVVFSQSIQYITQSQLLVPPPPPSHR